MTQSPTLTELVSLVDNSKRSTIEVLLADSQSIYHVGMRSILSMDLGIQVIAQVDTLSRLRDALQQHAPDIVVVDGKLLEGEGDAIEDLTARAKQSRLVVQLTEVDEIATVDLYRRGVRGVVSRSITPELLVRCVRKVAEGETWIDNKSISWVLNAYRTQADAAPPAEKPQLTTKEVLIVTCITRGMRNKEIALRVGTTEQVVKNYLRKIYEKLGVADRLELALYCLDRQILKDYPEANVAELAETSQHA